MNSQRARSDLCVCVCVCVVPGQLGNGTESALGDLPIYSSALPSSPPPSKTGLIVVYDVFAFQVPNTRAQCDRLAQLLGCNVVLPDFYRGGVSPMSDPSLGDFMTWVNSGNRRWERCVICVEGASAEQVAVTVVLSALRQQRSCVLTRIVSHR